MLARSFRPALLAGLLAFPAVARAQDAQALFDQGLEDMRAGRYKIGCALIKRSLEIDARPGTVFTLAECYSKAGKYASALVHYDRYLSLFAELSPEQQAAQQARAELSSTERNRLVGLVAWLTVNLPRTAPPGLVVTRDGEAFAGSLFGAAMAVDPGAHVFTTRAPDGPLIEQRVDVTAGERKMVVLQVRGAAGSEPTPDFSSPYAGDAVTDGERPPEKGVTPWVYVTGGIGAAGLVTGAVTGLMALDRKSVMQRECDLALNQCSQKGLDARNLINETLTPINAVGWSVGGAGAVATVLILLLDTSGSSEAAAAASGWSPTVGLAETGAMVGVFSAF